MTEIEITDKGLNKLKKLMNKLDGLGVPLRDSKKVHEYIEEMRELKEEIIIQ